MKIERDAVLRARDVRVIGNIQGEDARRVNVVDGSRIGGSVQSGRRERWRETFQEGTYGLEIQELRGNGEKVFSVLREWGRGRGSGIVVEDHDYAHWKARNGKIVYLLRVPDAAQPSKPPGCRSSSLWTAMKKGPLW